jgi:tRNA-dihydrouridine synthase B
MQKAVETICACGVDGIDLNIACPARAVVKSCSGSALMGDLVLLEQVLRLVRLLTSMPLTIKMRAGFKKKNALEVVKLAQDCGVNAIAIHPRLQTQQFGGELDYALVYEIKHMVTIPVLYSGGIKTYADARFVYEKTGVDGFLIGRALCGAPWKLAELEAHAQNKFYEITMQQRGRMALKHLELLLEYYGPRGLYHFRKHIPWYITGDVGALQMRKRLMIAQSIDVVKQGLQDFFGV